MMAPEALELALWHPKKQSKHPNQADFCMAILIANFAAKKAMFNLGLYAKRRHEKLFNRLI